jgi:hypothetical protein
VGSKHVNSKRQPDDKFAALSGTAFYFDFAVVRFDNLFYQTQAQTVSMDLRFDHFFAAIEGFEYLRAVAG